MGSFKCHNALIFCKYQISGGIITQLGTARFWIIEHLTLSTWQAALVYCLSASYKTGLSTHWYISILKGHGNNIWNGRNVIVTHWWLPVLSFIPSKLVLHMSWLALYLKLIHAWDFKNTEEVMSTMYQYSFNFIKNTACLFWPGWYSGAPSGDYVNSDTWLEGSPPQIS